jgi:hypothetical protein
MGQNFCAVLGHHLDARAVEALPHTLGASAAPRLAEALAYLDHITVRELDGPASHPLWETWHLSGDASATAPSTVEQWAAGEWVSVDGPGGVSISSLGRAAAVRSHWIRWGAFLVEPSLQEALRDVCYELARVLESPMVVYVPEYWYPEGFAIDGLTIGQIVSVLREQHGAPATSISAIYRSNPDGTWSGKGYYIDTFSDRVAEPRQAP